MRYQGRRWYLSGGDLGTHFRGDIPLSEKFFPSLRSEVMIKLDNARLFKGLEGIYPLYPALNPRPSYDQGRLLEENAGIFDLSNAKEEPNFNLNTIRKVVKAS